MSPQMACLRGCIITLVALVCFFSTVSFKLLTQRAWIIAGKVTLVAFVWLISTVRFQMCPQIACICWCKVTLVAHVWLFSTVCLQMCLQMACLRGCIVTLAAFVWPFSTVRFQMCPQVAFLRWGIVALVAFVWLFSFIIGFLKGISISTPVSLTSLYLICWSITTKKEMFHEKAFPQHLHFLQKWGLYPGWACRFSLSPLFASLFLQKWGLSENLQCKNGQNRNGWRTP